MSLTYTKYSTMMLVSEMSQKNVIQVTEAHSVGSFEKTYIYVYKLTFLINPSECRSLLKMTVGIINTVLFLPTVAIVFEGNPGI